MPNLPRPKILPRVTYGPGGDVPNQMQTGGGVGTNNPYGGMSAGEAWDNQRAQAMGMMPQTQTSANVGRNAPVVTYDPNPVAANYGLSNRPIPSNTTQPTTAPVGGTPVNQSVADHAKLMQDAVNKNRAGAAAAVASGNSAEKARLDEEWARLTKSPLYQAMWGGGDENAMKQRLVNVYMDPKNSAAQQDFASAAARAASDDIWAREATNVFGRPPNQLEWDEHWKAMNVGGRDPLEGHPQAIQNIKAAATGLATGNQQTVYDQYSKWLG